MEDQKINSHIKKEKDQRGLNIDLNIEKARDQITDLNIKKVEGHNIRKESMEKMVT